MIDINSLYKLMVESDINSLYKLMVESESVADTGPATHAQIVLQPTGAISVSLLPLQG